MRLPPVRLPLSALTLALLAACGGGNDSGNNAVSATRPGTTSASTATAGSSAGASSTVTVNTQTGNSAAGGTTTPAAGAAGSTAAPAAGGTSSPSAGGTSTTPPAPTGRGEGSDAPPATGTDTGNAGSGTTPPTPPAEVPLISGQGVRGDVFLAMLEQKPCGSTNLNPVPAPDGSFLSERFRDIAIVDTDLGNYWITPGHPRGGYDNTLGCNHHNYATVKPGEHRYAIEHTYFAKVTGLVRGWQTLHVRFPVTITEDEVRIAQQFEQNHGSWTGERPAPQTFRAESPTTVKLKENLPFGTTWTWNGTAPADPAKPHFVKMLLQKDDTTPRDARLCWNVDFSYVKRLQCIHWRIPEDWKFGQQLTVVDQTLVEDRSVYPGESGFAYWRARTGD